jgi:hypothetical protein
MTKLIFDSELDPSLYVQDINMGQVYVGREPVCSTGLTTCIGLIAISDNNDIVAGHFTGVGDEESFGDRKAFQKAVIKSVELGAKRLWLVGGGPYFENDLDTVEIDRSFAIQEVKKIPGSEVTIQWTIAGKAVDFAVEPIKVDPVTLYVHNKL